MQKPEDKGRLISMKVSEFLLESFKAKSELHQFKYQTQIKKIMIEWVNNQK
jgi:predicted DNA binding CopG/RHH family protein